MAKKKKIETVQKTSTDLTYEQKLERARETVAQSKKDGTGLTFASEMREMEFISTGIEALDRLMGAYSTGPNPEYLGRGGIPRGRYVVVWGPELCGKSTLLYRIIAKAQAQEKVCLLVDAESRATVPWMQAQGVDTSTLLWHRGGVLENTLQTLIEQISMVDFAVIDTVNALAPKSELEDNKGAARGMKDDAPMGRTAASLSKFFRIATHRVSTANVSVVLVGQARDAIGAQVPMKQIVGGNALAHYATIRLNISKITGQSSLDGASIPKKKVTSTAGDIIEVPSGFLQKIKLEKAGTNHLENQHILVPFLYGLGPDDFKSNIMAAVAAGIIGVNGPGRYEVPTRDGVVNIHGKEALIEFFQKDTSFYEWLMNSVTKTKEEVEE